ncbi:hypothetical protein Efla_006483 [Eimeria flavescens]
MLTGVLLSPREETAEAVNIRIAFAAFTRGQQQQQQQQQPWQQQLKQLGEGGESLLPEAHLLSAAGAAVPKDLSCGAA